MDNTIDCAGYKLTKDNELADSYSKIIQNPDHTSKITYIGSVDMHYQKCNSSQGILIIKKDNEVLNTTMGNFSHGNLKSGQRKYANGNLYNGEFVDNKPRGEGSLYDASGQVLFNDNRFHSELILSDDK